MTKIEFDADKFDDIISGFDSTLFDNYDFLRLEHFSEEEQESLEGLYQLIRLKIFLDGEWRRRKRYYLAALNQRVDRLRNLPVGALQDFVSSL